MNAIPKTNCPLCSAESYPYSGREFCRCRLCKAIFRLPEFRLLPEKEKKRYQEHNNDIHDPKYRNFVSPITNEITNKYGPQHRGLDFGSGTGPVVSRILQEQGYDIRQYDPFFCPDRRVLDFYYDFIVCCEVAEHFYYPLQEFQLFRKLIKPKGRLYCMTHLYTDTIDFDGWYYKNDHSHVFFYSQETLEWILQACGFSAVSVQDRLVIFA